MKKQTTPVKEIKQFKYRYVCPACTNNASFCYDKELGNVVICQYCGKQITLNKIENFIKL